MTTATHPTTTTEEDLDLLDEDELEERIAQHRSEHEAILESVRETLAKADAADADRAALTKDFTRPAEGLAEDISALDRSATELRRQARLLEERAAAYLETSRLAELEAALVDRRAEREQAEAQWVAWDRFVAIVTEFEVRFEDAVMAHAAAAQNKRRLEELETELSQLSDFELPKGFPFGHLDRRDPKRDDYRGVQRRGPGTTTGARLAAAVASQTKQVPRMAGGAVVGWDPVSAVPLAPVSKSASKSKLKPPAWLPPRPRTK